MSNCPPKQKYRRPKRLLYNTALALGLLFNSHVFHLARVAGLADRAPLDLHRARRRVLVVLHAAVGAARGGVQLGRLFGRVDRVVGGVNEVGRGQRRRRATRRRRYRLAAFYLLDYRVGLSTEVAAGLEGVVPSTFRAEIKEKMLNN